MIISDLNVLEVVEAAEVVGGVIGVRGNRANGRNINSGITFDSVNTFRITITEPRATGNSAAAGADADAYNDVVTPILNIPAATYSFTKADSGAYADYLGGSTSRSTSVAVINGVL